MVRAHLHCVVEASAGSTEVTTSGNSGLLEPAPRGTNLTTVAAERLACKATAASSGVSDREEGGVGSTSGDANTIVESLSGAMSPAGTAVRLVAHVVDYGLAFGPLNTGVEVRGKSGVGLESDITALNTFDGPIGINNSAHEALDFLTGGTSEFGVVASNPVGLGVGVDNFDVLGEIERLLISEEVHDVFIGAEVHVHAALMGVGEVQNFSLVSEHVDSLEELGELSVNSINFHVLAISREFDNVLAKLADVVVLSEELVDSASVGDGDEGGYGNCTHSVSNFWVFSLLLYTTNHISRDYLHKLVQRIFPN